MISEADVSRHVKGIRRFNRFYTKQIGLLEDGLLHSPFSLTEARVIYEMGQRQVTTATELAERLSLDMGYLSRILAGFQKGGLVDKQPSDTDARQNLLRLTGEGRENFLTLNTASQRQIEQMLGELSGEEQIELLRAMYTIESLLGAPVESRVPYILRPPAVGDFGWVVYRHGMLYAREYGWDERFEAVVAEIIAGYIRDFDPRKDYGWIAEKDGENVGSVFLVKQSETVARLRMLLVEPKARGLGIGTRLVDECIRKARQFGYQKIILWTMQVLVDARRIYERAGFQLMHQEPNLSFGDGLIEQTWELEL